MRLLWVLVVLHSRGPSKHSVGMYAAVMKRSSVMMNAMDEVMAIVAVSRRGETNEKVRFHLSCRSMTK